MARARSTVKRGSTTASGRGTTSSAAPIATTKGRQSRRASATASAERDAPGASRDPDVGVPAVATDAAGGPGTSELASRSPTRDANAVDDSSGATASAGRHAPNVTVSQLTARAPRRQRVHTTKIAGASITDSTTASVTR